ncbi:MAG TPA: hypothetical protein DIW46_00730 [Microbacterium sp.]|nr:hypothetical protein [Microbacterium sp.]
MVPLLRTARSRASTNDLALATAASAPWNARTTQPLLSIKSRGCEPGASASSIRAPTCRARVRRRIPLRELPALHAGVAEGRIAGKVILIPGHGRTRCKRRVDRL